MASLLRAFPGSLTSTASREMLVEATLAVGTYLLLRTVVGMGINAAIVVFDLTMTGRAVLNYYGYSLFLLTAASMLLVAVVRRQRSLLWPAISRSPTWRWLLIASGLILACLTLEIGLHKSLGIKSGDASWIRPLLFGDDGSLQIPFVVLVVVVGPLAEEFLFRGVLFRFARLYMPFLFSSILISIFFASYHTRYWSYDLERALVALGGAFLTSMMACYVLDRSGSIWTAVLLHSLRNALAVVGYHVSAWL